MPKARWKMAYPGVEGDWLQGEECPLGYAVYGMKLRLQPTMEEQLGLLRIKAASFPRDHSSGKFPASKCVDGITSHSTADDHGGPGSSLCRPDGRNTPKFLSIELEKMSSVKTVILYNRVDANWKRARDLRIWVTPDVVDHQSSGLDLGYLLGSFKGPGKKGEVIVITNSTIRGKFVTITQKRTKQPFNLLEVQVFEKDPSQSRHHVFVVVGIVSLTSNTLSSRLKVKPRLCGC